MKNPNEEYPRPPEEPFGPDNTALDWVDVSSEETLVLKELLNQITEWSAGASEAAAPVIVVAPCRSLAANYLPNCRPVSPIYEEGSVPRQREETPDIIDIAIERGDQPSAKSAIHEIDIRLGRLDDPSARAGLLLNKAVFLGALTKYQEARQELQRALEQAPEDPSVQLSHDYIEGCILHQERRLSEAFISFSALLSQRAEQLRQPENRFIYEDIQQQRAFEAADVRDYETAIPILQEILAFDLKPEDRARALADLGIASFQMKNYEAARDHLFQALKLGQPASFEGHIRFYLGIACAQTHMLEEAKTQLLACAQRATEWGLSHRNVYGWLHVVCDRLGEAALSKEYRRLARPD